MAAAVERPVAAGIVFGEPESLLAGIPEILRSDDIRNDLSAFEGLICDVWPKRRQSSHARALAYGITEFPSLVHPSAVIPPSLSLGRSVFINAGAVFGGAAEIEDFVIVNRAASVGHHCAIEEFASIGPGVTLASNCRIGRGAMIGAGAVLAPGVRIGDGAVVSAGALVLRDVPPNVTVMGNPARQVRDQDPKTHG
jgi:sugar O-acyltransferase (sialic acid O-acetyltransferase NeuD family)